MEITGPRDLAPAEVGTLHRGPEPPVVSKWSGWEVFLTPALAVLGLAMIIGAFAMYPRTNEVPSPDAPGTLSIKAHFPVSSISYGVTTLSAATAAISITVNLSDTAPRPSGRARAIMAFSLPSDASFWQCPKPPPGLCTRPIGRKILGVWGQLLTFGPSGEANFNFFVKAHNTGITSNGVTAAAVLPGVFWQGPGQQPLLIAAYDAYNLDSAAAYDWSPAPARVDNWTVEWNEPLAKGGTAPLTVTGVNHGEQSFDDFVIFLAGALVALGGGAILAAIIEAMHRRDWETIRALRTK